MSPQAPARGRWALGAQGPSQAGPPSTVTRRQRRAVGVGITFTRRQRRAVGWETRSQETEAGGRVGITVTRRQRWAGRVGNRTRWLWGMSDAGAESLDTQLWPPPGPRPTSPGRRETSGTPVSSLRTRPEGSRREGVGKQVHQRRNVQGSPVPNLSHRPRQ